MGIIRKRTKLKHESHDIMITRRMYLENSRDDSSGAAYEEFLEQFMHPDIDRLVLNHFGLETLLKSDKPWFNDIHLGRWDLICRVQLFPREVLDKLQMAYIEQGGLKTASGHEVFFHSDMLPILKYAAIKIKRKHEQAP